MEMELHGTTLLQTALDALPSLIFIVDEDVRVQGYNTAAAGLLGDNREVVINHRGGEVLCCIHSTDVPEGCGRAPFCRDCGIRNSVSAAFKGNRIVRHRAKIEIIRDGKLSTVYALITATPFRYNERPLVLLVVEDFGIISELQQLVTICSVCKEIQDGEKTWHRLEAYFKKHWEIDFSHGLCPKCFSAQMKTLNTQKPAEQTEKSILPPR